MRKMTLLIACFFMAQFGSAQVLFEEDFDNYPAGHLNTDYTGTTTGQGGWRAERLANGSVVMAMVAPEAGKGNVLTITTNGVATNEYVYIRQDDGVIDALWNNRTAGNNVLKLEFEIYGSVFFYSVVSLSQSTPYHINPLIQMTFAATTGHYISGGHAGSHLNGQLKQYDTTTFPYDMWIKAEMFIDYNTQKAYFYIPTLNLFRADTLNPIPIGRDIPINIGLRGGYLQPTSVVKYDNIKLTALQSVPTYIDALSTGEWFASTFNLYPNPTENVVNITNSENMTVQQVAVYDVTGKQLSIHSFNNETEIQLNVENLASGVYMLHIETNEGAAVKKLVKK